MTAPGPRHGSGPERPQLSVVVATWNRSNVLRVAIGSALRQGFGDFELLVVGDACTDDSEQVVASFRDPRIRFVNLARNCGEQSGPNNAGCALARGRFVAYLNHDDLWFPDHLETAVALLERSGADLAFAPAAAARRAAAGEAQRFVVHGASGSGDYAPWLFVPASAWVLRRELVAAVGPWRPALECRTESSQDWLFRAFRLGRSLRSTGRLGVLTLPSGERPGAYATREDREHQGFARRMREEPQRLREEILASVALELAARRAQPRLGLSMKRVFRALAYRACARLGVHPRALPSLMRLRRRGWGIQELRRIRGLRPLPR